MEELADGELGKAEGKVRELGRELDKLIRADGITTAEAAKIRVALDAVATALADSRTALDPGREDDD